MKKINTKDIINILTIINVILIAIFFVYGIKTNIFTDKEALMLFLKKVGVFGPIIFFMIQVFQVIVPVVPGNVTCAVGVLVFGPVYGFLYNYVSIVLGSIIVFFISRRYGMVVINKLFSEEKIKKYIGWLDENKRFETLFALAIFLPVAPDDLLCYLAGITKISVKKYVMILILLKPFTIVSYSFILTYLTSLLLKIHLF